VIYNNGAAQQPTTGESTTAKKNIAIKGMLLQVPLIPVAAGMHQVSQIDLHCTLCGSFQRHLERSDREIRLEGLKKTEKTDGFSLF
jgi:hypothetical protein